MSCRINWGKRLRALEPIDLTVVGALSTAYRAETSLSLSTREAVRSDSTLVELPVRTIRAVARSCDLADLDRRIAKSPKIQYFAKSYHGVQNILILIRTVVTSEQ